MTSQQIMENHSPLLQIAKPSLAKRKQSYNYQNPSKRQNRNPFSPIQVPVFNEPSPLVLSPLSITNYGPSPVKTQHYENDDPPPPVQTPPEFKPFRTSEYRKKCIPLDEVEQDPALMDFSYYSSSLKIKTYASPLELKNSPQPMDFSPEFMRLMDTENQQPAKRKLDFD